MIISTVRYYPAIKRNKLLTDTTIRMNLKNILSKRNQMLKKLYDSIYIKFWNRQKSMYVLECRTVIVFEMRVGIDWNEA